MDQRKFEKDNIGVHHGARQVDAQFLTTIIPGLKDLKKTINTFREVAYKYNICIDKSQYYKENFNNNISILAERGMGKSSTIITIIDQIENNNFFMENENSQSIRDDLKKNFIDIINPMIDPEEINNNSSILGWAMTSLFEQMDLLLNDTKKNLSLCQYMHENDDIEKKLQSKRNELKKYYSIYNDEYSDVALNNSINKHAFKDNLFELLTYDYKLKQCLFEFIDLLVKYKRLYNCNCLSPIEKEPLIYFFFDDVDVSSQKSIKILMDILSYFSHPNIVVFISGDYEVFEQSVMTFFMKETKDITLKFSDSRKEKEIGFAKDRAEYFLKKVLPPSYRFYIQEFSDDSAKIHYNYHSVYNSKFEDKNIFALLTYVFYSGFYTEYKNGKKEMYLKTFMVPSTSDVSKDNEDDLFKFDINNALIQKESDAFYHYLYAYLSVFSVNTRGFMNVYNYLVKEANVICEGDYDIKRYWNINKFEEFLNILIDSKHTYIKYQNQICKFLYVKSQYDNKESSYTKLRIDCEELELFVNSMMKKLDKSYQKDVLEDIYTKEDECNYIKDEIKSIIMLPIFINELFCCIHYEDYYQRYIRIQEKLKNILTKVFVNSLNPNIMILPTHLGLRRTLCIFYSVISRMSAKALKNLNTKYGEGYDLANNKKYIVQLYFATIHLNISGSKIDHINDDTVFLEKGYNKLAVLDKKYKISTYSNLKKRTYYEKIISKKMNGIFRHLDREWLADKVKFASAITPDINKIEYAVYSRFIEKISSTYDIENQLGQLYYYICFEDSPSIKTYYFRLFGMFDKIDDSDISGKITEDTLRSYVDEIISSFYVMNEDGIDQFFNKFENQINQRVSESSLDNSSIEFEDKINDLLNLLDDFKTEYEVLMNRLSYLDKTGDQIENILYSKLEEYFGIELWESNINDEDMIEELILEVKLDCMDRKFDKLKEDLKDIIENFARNMTYKENYKSKKLQKIIDNISYSLLRVTQSQERESHHQLASVSAMINTYLQCYYMYTFILEYVRVMNLTNTKFFKIFKEGINYRSERK